jgi:hypothetical protein
MGSSVRRLACTRAGAVLLSVTITVAIVDAGLTAVPGAAAEASPLGGAWHRPVDGAVARPFEQPSSVYGPGHRGVDFASAPGTPVRAANAGIVTFAGAVAGTLHVTLAHGATLRTSYSYLQSVAVREGQTVARDDIVGVSGGSDDDHAGTVLHFGVRVGDRYVDPMLLFRPDDLTKLVRLVPTTGVDEQPWTAADERRELQASLHLPLPAGTADLSAIAGDEEDGGCGDDVPIVGGVVNAACDIGGWVGDRSGEALDAGLDVLDTATDVASVVLDQLRAPLRETLTMLRELPAEFATEVARTPIGMLALDIVEIGRRFVDTVTAECSDDAPPADGTGGSAHRVMVVAGINSSGLAGDRGPTVELDVGALGYRRADGEVRYYSYAADGGPYVAADTLRDLEGSGHLLAEQLRAMQREQPGREVDLIAHSQGGVVVDAFLHNDYSASDPTFPPIGTVVTLSSPHEGAPAATVAAQLRGSAVGRVALDAAGDVRGSLPPAASPSVQGLSERSPLIAGVQRRGVPEHIDFTSIGATEDVMVPATNISLPGADETTVAVNSLSEHTAIVQDPAALRAVRAALEGRAPPCVGIDTALRGAIAPVVISRIEHLVGSATAGEIPRGTP